MTTPYDVVNAELKATGNPLADALGNVAGNTIVRYGIPLFKMVIGAALIGIGLLVTFLPDIAEGAAVAAGFPELAPVASAAARGKPHQAVRSYVSGTARRQAAAIQVANQPATAQKVQQRRAAAQRAFQGYVAYPGGKRQAAPGGPPPGGPPPGNPPPGNPRQRRPKPAGPVPGQPMQQAPGGPLPAGPTPRKAPATTPLGVIPVPPGGVPATGAQIPTPLNNPLPGLTPEGQAQFEKWLKGNQGARWGNITKGMPGYTPPAPGEPPLSPPRRAPVTGPLGPRAAPTTTPLEPLTNEEDSKRVNAIFRRQREAFDKPLTEREVEISKRMSGEETSALPPAAPTVLPGSLGAAPKPAAKPLPPQTPADLPPRKPREPQIGQLGVAVPEPPESWAIPIDKLTGRFEEPITTVESPEVEALRVERNQMVEDMRRLEKIPAGGEGDYPARLRNIFQMRQRIRDMDQALAMWGIVGGRRQRKRKGS